MDDKTQSRRRFQQLEKRVQYLIWGQVACGCLAFVAIIFAASVTPRGNADASTKSDELDYTADMIDRVVKARGFEVIDEDGLPRASLYCDEQGPGLVLFQKMLEGEHFHIYCDADQTYWKMGDPQGKTRMFAIARDDKTEISISDANVTTRWSVAHVALSNMVTESFYNEAGREMVSTWAVGRFGQQSYADPKTREDALLLPDDVLK